MSILDKIIQQKQIEVARLEENRLDIEKLLAKASPSRGFVRTFFSSPKPRIIAEVKKASPSKGLISLDFHPTKIAKHYEKNGASAISVLTDQNFFQGNLSYLKEIKSAVKLPLLRKDFIINELQISEARGAGADAVLLIAAILTPEKLDSLINKSFELNLDVLLEVHNQKEMQETLNVLDNLRVDSLSKHLLLGINNRDLNTFETSLSTTIDLLGSFNKQIDSLGLSVISESGIFKSEDIEHLQKFGAAGFLIGEALMKDESLLEQLSKSN